MPADAAVGRPNQTEAAKQVQSKRKKDFILINNVDLFFKKSVISFLNVKECDI